MEPLLLSLSKYVTKCLNAISPTWQTIYIGEGDDWCAIYLLNDDKKPTLTRMVFSSGGKEITFYDNRNSQSVLIAEKAIRFTLAISDHVAVMNQLTTILQNSQS
jgi:hypothetical protein